MPLLPYGTIVLWHGSVASIPPGFHLCDGTAGTPDLRDKFILGAGAGHNPGDAGGALTHTHTVTTTGHTHVIPAGTDFAIGIGYSDIPTASSPGGSADARNHLPPYHALAYIMRI